MMTDPIADMLTRMRNALRNRSKKVKMPHSSLKVAVADCLKREGYIDDFRTIEPQKGKLGGKQGWVELDLKYGPEGEDVVTSIERVSKPGRRVYSQSTEIPLILNGLGITILSTPQGIMSGREARSKNVGGEILCRVT
jgi:small subunit ribosomal protein S8